MRPASAPPASITSAWPRRMISAASPMAFALDAHAETWPMFGPLARYFIAISPAAMSMIIIGIRNGDTLRGSFCWTSTWATRVWTQPHTMTNPSPVRGAARRSSPVESSERVFLEGLESCDLRRLDERSAREKDERDADERQLETRESDIPQMAYANEVPVREPALPPERGVRENGR